jgi:uncharacterized protein (TIGR02147 family)
MKNLEKNYRDILKDELERRCQHNPRYSLRAFARDLDLSPARVSEILKGKTGLSKERATIVAKRLGFSVTEIEFFADLVESEHARSQVKKNLAKIRLSKHESKTQQLVQLDTFRLISDWYHFAILELLTIKSAQHKISWISDSLQISEHEALSAIDRLIRLGFLSVKKGKWVPTDENSVTQAEIPSEAVRRFHGQILEKAIQALNLQSVESRDFTTLTLSFSKEQMRDAKQELKKVRRDFVKKFGNSEQSDSVYCLAFQFFQLTNSKGGDL